MNSFVPFVSSSPPPFDENQDDDFNDFKSATPNYSLFQTDCSPEKEIELNTASTQSLKYNFVESFGNNNNIHNSSSGIINTNTDDLITHLESDSKLVSAAVTIKQNFNRLDKNTENIDKTRLKHLEKDALCSEKTPTIDNFPNKFPIKILDENVSNPSSTSNESLNNINSNLTLNLNHVDKCISQSNIDELDNDIDNFTSKSTNCSKSSNIKIIKPDNIKLADELSGQLTNSESKYSLAKSNNSVITSEYLNEYAANLNGTTKSNCSQSSSTNSISSNSNDIELKNPANDIAQISDSGSDHINNITDTDWSASVANSNKEFGQEDSYVPDIVDSTFPVLEEDVQHVVEEDEGDAMNLHDYKTSDVNENYFDSTYAALNIKLSPGLVAEVPDVVNNDDDDDDWTDFDAEPLPSGTIDEINLNPANEASSFKNKEDDWPHFEAGPLQIDSIGEIGLNPANEASAFKNEDDDWPDFEAGPLKIDSIGEIGLNPANEASALKNKDDDWPDFEAGPLASNSIREIGFNAANKVTALTSIEDEVPDSDDISYCDSTETKVFKRTDAIHLPSEDTSLTNFNNGPVINDFDDRVDDYIGNCDTLNTDDDDWIDFKRNEKESNTIGRENAKLANEIASSVVEDSDWAEFESSNNESILLDSKKISDTFILTQNPANIIDHCFDTNADNPPSGCYGNLSNMLREEGVSCALTGSIGMRSRSLWSEIKVIEETPALRLNWTTSCLRLGLLKSINIDANNIVSLNKNMATPVFPNNIGLLQPMKMELNQPIENKLRESPKVINRDVQSVHFDWSNSGLKNPLEVNGCFSLDLDFFLANDLRVKTAIMSKVSKEEFELLESLGDIRPSSATNHNNSNNDFVTAVTPPVTTEKAAAILDSFKAATQPVAAQTLSAEAEAILAELPDLSFMASKVLMFPVWQQQQSSAAK